MDSLMNTLTILVVFLIFIIMVLVFVYWYMSYSSKKKSEKNEESTTNTTKVAKEYTKKSIFKFMQFDKIEDNMIVQDNETKYLMVIECEGINYDLMSQVEKTAVEAGFVQFLNTLRYPIQIYTQTRTINISESILQYRNQLENTKKELDMKQKEYNRMLNLNENDEKQIEEVRREMIRLNNLYEYGLDVINDIEKTSNNKNVLRKHYYIVVPYYAAEIGTDLLDAEEKKSMIFSELYTRCQSLIRVLFACEMKCKILDSNELVELLYVAYNRDDSEIYGVDKALQAGYAELYSTAPDVLDKKMRALDKQIEERALELAKNTLDEVKTEKERKIRKKEKDFENLVKKMAEELLKENQAYVGKEITEEALERIENDKTEEGGNEDEQKKATKRTRRITGTK